ncbi:hypothetical protein Q5424_06160 [Conexibacter sp. JD483]|uniref:hypothetical protein n=1 Tax=unclassified Conexibacter TaxID=2627773 RepID=UPI00272580DB|nr:MULTISPECIES: hypothetical protein [unclassified Conexibacter]MDO8185166.1 hypothetical protein [Conexibacter sp. CPCC 205706]MDO8196876.1 hypothetical protein [Conexibacter sp. CPCC 205762]MDR9368652.1 hypothetical protein [Conexibacter sp. JD483]
MRGAAKWLATAAVALTAAAGAAPTASADTEPNDGITQVEGPLGGGVTYAGGITTANDSDWYFVYVQPQTQLDISLTTPGESPCNYYDASRLTLRTSDGGSIASTVAARNETSHIRYTTPAALTRYLLQLDADCTGGSYRFRLDPATAVVSGPGLPAPLPAPEPNESAGQAYGPLSGGTPYAGTIDTQNDVDWFWFYSAGPYAYDLTLTGVGGGCSDDVDARLYADGSSSSIDGLSAYPNTVSHLVRTAPGFARYLIEVTGCQGAAYRVQLDPGTAIALAPPAPPPAPPAAVPAPKPKPKPKASKRCRTARAGQVRWSRAIAKSRRQLRRVSTRSARRKLKRKLAAQQRTLRRASDRVTIYCR